MESLAFLANLFRFVFDIRIIGWDQTGPYLLGALIGGYLLGSIPFGLVLCYAAGYGDIRKIGSRSIGATNVLRTGNRPLALATLVLDSGKGAAAVLIAALYGPHTMILAGAGAVVGHLFPVWLRFKGGKGVATTLGTLLAVAPSVGALACLTWLVVALPFRYSSLASLAAMALSPVYSWLLATYGPVDWPLWMLSTSQVTRLALFVAILVFIRHQANIRRLLSGTEPKIGKRKAAEGDG